MDLMEFPKRKCVRRLFEEKDCIHGYNGSECSSPICLATNCPNIRCAFTTRKNGINDIFMPRNSSASVMELLQVGEHLNNVGKFRAFKSVPLPFTYYEDENGNGENEKDE